MSSNPNPFHDVTFIIGAGAHCPYGLPSGNMLTDLLKSMYVDAISSQSAPAPNSLPRSLRSHIINAAAGLLEETLGSGVPMPPSICDTHLRNFLKSFCESGVQSIDAFLSTLDKKEDRQVAEVWAKLGKLTIAVVITHYENVIPFGSSKSDWIEHLINEYIKDSVDKFFRYPPSIITFNYDRFFERRILKHLTEYHHFPYEKAVEMVDSLKILHVYGDLGRFSEWEVEPSIDFYRQTLSEVRIIGEDRREERARSLLLQAISERVVNSGRVYFLGYGFDKSNNVLLNRALPDNWTKERQIFSTSKGLTGSDVTKIREQLNFSCFKVNSNHVEQVDCMQLLREIEPPNKKIIAKATAGRS